MGVALDTRRREPCVAEPGPDELASLEALGALWREEDIRLRVRRLAAVRRPTRLPRPTGVAHEMEGHVVALPTGPRPVGDATRLPGDEVRPRPRLAVLVATGVRPPKTPVATGRRRRPGRDVVRRVWPGGTEKRPLAAQIAPPSDTRPGRTPATRLVLAPATAGPPDGPSADRAEAAPCGRPVARPATRLRLRLPAVTTRLP